MSTKLNFFELIQLAKELYGLYREMEQDGTIKEIAEAFEAVQGQLKDEKTHKFIQTIRGFFQRG